MTWMMIRTAELEANRLRTARKVHEQLTDIIIELGKKTEKLQRVPAKLDC